MFEKILMFIWLEKRKIEKQSQKDDKEVKSQIWEMEFSNFMHMYLIF